MSINETEYRMDIEGLQGALGYLSGRPELTVTPDSVVLVVFSDGQAGPPLRGSRSIAKVLDAAAEQFYNEGGIGI